MPMKATNHNTHILSVSTIHFLYFDDCYEFICVQFQMSGITKQEFNVMEMAGKSILASALAEEAELDAKLASMDAAMDEDTFEALRQKRKLQMQKQMRKEADLRQCGHGSYRELTDTKEFFAAAKKSARMIVRIIVLIYFCDVTIILMFVFVHV